MKIPVRFPGPLLFAGCMFLVAGRFESNAGTLTLVAGGGGLLLAP